jgi:hypothetical protein
MALNQHRWQQQKNGGTRVTFFVGFAESVKY